MRCLPSHALLSALCLFGGKTPCILQTPGLTGGVALSRQCALDEAYSHRSQLHFVFFWAAWRRPRKFGQTDGQIGELPEASFIAVNRSQALCPFRRHLLPILLTCGRSLMRQACSFATKLVKQPPTLTVLPRHSLSCSPRPSWTWIFILSPRPHLRPKIWPNQCSCVHTLWCPSQPGVALSSGGGQRNPSSAAEAPITSHFTSFPILASRCNKVQQGDCLALRPG